MLSLVSFCFFFDLLHPQKFLKRWFQNQHCRCIHSTENIIWNDYLNSKSLFIWSTKRLKIQMYHDYQIFLLKHVFLNGFSWNYNSCKCQTLLVGSNIYIPFHVKTCWFSHVIAKKEVWKSKSNKFENVTLGKKLVCICIALLIFILTKCNFLMIGKIFYIIFSVILLCYVIVE